MEASIVKSNPESRLLEGARLVSQRPCDTQCYLYGKDSAYRVFIKKEELRAIDFLASEPTRSVLAKEEEMVSGLISLAGRTDHLIVEKGKDCTLFLLDSHLKLQNLGKFPHRLAELPPLGRSVDSRGHSSLFFKMNGLVWGAYIECDWPNWDCGQSDLKLLSSRGDKWSEPFTIKQWSEEVPEELTLSSLFGKVALLVRQKSSLSFFTYQSGQWRRTIQCDFTTPLSNLQFFTWQSDSYFLSSDSARRDFPPEISKIAVQSRIGQCSLATFPPQWQLSLPGNARYPLPDIARGIEQPKMLIVVLHEKLLLALTLTRWDLDLNGVYYWHLESSGKSTFLGKSFAGLAIEEPTQWDEPVDLLFSNKRIYELWKLNGSGEIIALEQRAGKLKLSPQNSN